MGIRSRGRNQLNREPQFGDASESEHGTGVLLSESGWQDGGQVGMADNGSTSAHVQLTAAEIIMGRGGMQLPASQA
jgi:hypothetical protein